MKKEMKKVYFANNELSEKAFDIYSNSDFVFFQDAKNSYFVAENQNSTPHECGTIKNVIELLEALA